MARGIFRIVLIAISYLFCGMSIIGILDRLFGLSGINIIRMVSCLFIFLFIAMLAVLFFSKSINLNVLTLFVVRIIKVLLLICFSLVMLHFCLFGVVNGSESYRERVFPFFLLILSYLSSFLAFSI